MREAREEELYSMHMKNCLSKKLTLNRHGEHFFVHLFKCTGDLNGYLSRQKWFHGLPIGKGEDGDNRVLATTHFHSTSKSKKLADIYFSQENMSIDTICHESLHFGTGVMLLNKIKSISLKEPGDEESLATITGQTAQRIADYLYSLI
jgi:hypothetical protein